MFKKQITRFFVTLALLIAVMGSSGIVADWLGLNFTPQAHACNTGSSGGGDC